MDISDFDVAGRGRRALFLGNPTGSDESEETTTDAEGLTERACSELQVSVASTT